MKKTSHLSQLAKQQAKISRFSGIKPKGVDDVILLAKAALELKRILFSKPKDQIIEVLGGGLIETAAKLLHEVEDMIQSDGWRFHVAQAFQETFHRSEKRLRVVLGGNRSGKTMSGVWEAVTFAMGFNPYKPDMFIPVPCRVVICSQTTKTMREYINPYLFKFLPATEIKKIHYLRNDIIDRIVLNNGSVITLMSYDQGRSRFQGFSAFACHMDEEPPEDIYQEVLMRLVDKRGWLWMTLTPLSGLSWVYHQLYMNPDEDPEYEDYHWNIEDNAALSQDEIKRVLDKFPDEIRAARARGEFIGMSGIIYPWLMNDVAYCLPFDIPENWQRIRVIDNSGSGITACLWFAIDPYSNLWAYREYYKKGLSITDHAANIVRLSGTETFLYDLIDSASLIKQTGRELKSTYDYYVESLYRNHQRNTLVPMTEKSLQDGVVSCWEYMKAAKKYVNKENDGQHPYVRIFNNLLNTKKEARKYHWKATGSRSLDSGYSNKPVQKDCHLMDCLRYACHYGVRYNPMVEPTKRAPWREGWVENGLIPAR